MVPAACGREEWMTMRKCFEAHSGAGCREAGEAEAPLAMTCIHWLADTSMRSRAPHRTNACVARGFLPQMGAWALPIDATSPEPPVGDGFLALSLR